LEGSFRILHIVYNHRNYTYHGYSHTFDSHSLDSNSSASRCTTPARWLKAMNKIFLFDLYLDCQLMEGRSALNPAHFIASFPPPVPQSRIPQVTKNWKWKQGYTFASIVAITQM